MISSIDKEYRSLISKLYRAERRKEKEKKVEESQPSCESVES